MAVLSSFSLVCGRWQWATHSVLVSSLETAVYGQCASLTVDSCSLVLWWFLDRYRYHPYTRWFRDHFDARGGVSSSIHDLVRFLPVRLVHLHLPALDLDPAIDCGVLLPVLHPHAGIPHACIGIPDVRCCWSKHPTAPRRWCFRYHCCIRCLVCRATFLLQTRAPS